MNPQDDSVFLLEEVSEQEGTYNLLHQSATGELSRVAITLPVLPAGRQWQVNGLKALTANQYPVATARIRNGNQTEDVQLLLLSPAGETLAQFSVAANVSARLLKLDNGFAWVLNCPGLSSPGACVMRFVVLDEQLQVVSDSQSMYEGFTSLAKVSGLGDTLVVSSSTRHWLVDLTGNVERELEGLGDVSALEDNRFYKSAQGAYALLTPASAGFTLCRLDQALQTQWCKFINESDPSDLSVRDLDSYSARVVVDHRENAYLSFKIERMYNGLRGSLAPVPAPGIGLSVEMVGTRDLDVHHLQYAPDGRRLASAKETPFSEYGRVTIDWWSGISIDPEQTTAGVCHVAQTLPLAEGGLLALNHFCDADGGPYQFQLTRWD